jgi:hypothetical protein
MTTNDQGKAIPIISVKTEKLPKIDGESLNTKEVPMQKSKVKKKAQPK